VKGIGQPREAWRKSGNHGLLWRNGGAPRPMKMGNNSPWQYDVAVCVARRSLKLRQLAILRYRQLPGHPRSIDLDRLSPEW
jgi:hypothetical protein